MELERLKDMEKKTPEMSKGDWLDVMVRADAHEWMATKDFLTSGPNQRVVVVARRISRYKQMLVSFSLEQFLQMSSAGFHDFDTRSEWRLPEEEQIEYEPGKYKRCFKGGNLYLTLNDRRAILFIRENEAYEYSPVSSERFEVGFKVAGDPAEFDALLLEMLDFAGEKNFFRKAKINGDLSFIKLDRKYTWSDIVLPRKVEEEVRTNVAGVIRNQGLYEANAIPLKRGIVLKGKPGTGKTLMGKILCSELDCTFIWVTPSFLWRPRELCDVARETAPAILFIEDIDLVCSERDENPNKTVLGELMNELDGMKSNQGVVTIATTSRPELMETALLNRPGRFDRVIELPLPGPRERKAMAKLFAGPYMGGLEPSEEFITQTDGLTGAHVREVVNLALMRAVDAGRMDGQGKAILDERLLLSAVEECRHKDFQPVGFAKPRAVGADE